nr:TetR/AcrR family transcriptional regulator [Ralstonia sp. ASV6]
MLDVAKAAFAQKGVSASLEDIAREAGLGIGTLYRHFPTREALIDEIYRDEGNRLVEAAQQLSAQLAPLDAIQAWLLLFIGYLSNKQIHADVLNCMVSGEDGEGADRLCTLSADAIIGALTLLMQRAREAGEIHHPIEPLELLCAIAGVATFGVDTDWEAGAKRLVGLMVSGLRNPMPV